MWHGERKTIPESILSTFLHWVLFLTKCLFWESFEIKFCQPSTFLSCMSGPLSISQSSKSLCLFNKRQAEPKKWSAVPENLDFVPSIHCLSSLSLSVIYLGGRLFGHRVECFSPISKPTWSFRECCIWNKCVQPPQYPLSVQTSLSHRPAKHAGFCYTPITARWWKAGQCLIGRLSKCKGGF